MALCDRRPSVYSEVVFGGIFMSVLNRFLFSLPFFFNINSVSAIGAKRILVSVSSEKQLDSFQFWNENEHSEGIKNGRKESVPLSA